MIKCDIQEQKEQTIVRYLEGLKLKYTNVVELQLSLEKIMHPLAFVSPHLTKVWRQK